MYSVYVNLKTEESFLETLGYEHAYINHTKVYVDEVHNWLHTNNIENTWRKLKAIFFF